MNAYELKNVALMLKTARGKPSPGVAGSLDKAGPGQAAVGTPLDSYLVSWAADPNAFPDGTVGVYRLEGEDYLTGDAAFVNALEGLRDLTKLPIRPVPLEPGAAEFLPLEHAEAVASLRRAGIIA